MSVHKNETTVLLNQDRIIYLSKFLSKLHTSLTKRNFFLENHVFAQLLKEITSILPSQNSEVHYSPHNRDALIPRPSYKFPSKKST
jgi:hypothetical protein